MAAYSIPPERLLALLARRAAYEHLESELVPDQYQRLLSHRQHWLEGLEVQDLDALAAIDATVVDHIELLRHDLRQQYAATTETAGHA